MSILKRELLYTTKGGKVQFLDWAITQTTLGACAEPFHIKPHAPNTGFLDLDPGDMMLKVDSLQHVESEDDAVKALSGGGRPLNGGAHQPRVLIFTGN